MALSTVASGFASGVNYAVSRDDRFYVTDSPGPAAITRSGEVAWQSSAVPEGVHLRDAVAFTADGVFLGTAADDDGAGGQLLAVERSSGAERWRLAAPDDGVHGHVDAVAAVSPDLVVAGVDDTGSGDEQAPLVYGVDPGSGEQLWRTDELPATFVEEVLVHEGVPYVVTIAGVFRCDPDTGALSEAFGQFLGFGGSVLADGVGYFAGNPLRAYEFGAGEQRWATETLGDVKARPAADGEQVFAGTDTGYVYALDAATGEVQWKQRTRAQVVDVEATSGHLWVTDEAGGFSGFDRTSGAVVHEHTVTPDSGASPWRHLGTLGDLLLVGDPSARLLAVGGQ